MPQYITRPGRWIRNCIDVPVNPCDALNQSDWNQIEWVLSGGGVACIFVLPNLVDGNIISVDSFPSGGLFNSSGAQVATLTYNVGLGCYEPDAEVFPTYTTYALIENIDVTIIGGTSCVLSFQQFFSNTVEIPAVRTDEFALITNIGGAFAVIIGNSVGTMDMGDTTVIAYDASGGTDTVNHVYAAGTFEAMAFNGNDTTRIDCQNQGLLQVDLQRATAWTNIDFSNNNSLITVLWPSVHTVITTNINLQATGISALNLSAISNKGGFISASNSTNLQTVTLGSSPQTITDLSFDGCDVQSSLDCSGLVLTGRIDMANNSNLGSINLGNQTGNIDELDLQSCDLSSLDLSVLTNLGLVFSCANNSNLTTITEGASSRAFTLFNVENCDLSTLDLSGYTGLGGDTRIRNNSSLSSVTNPTSSELFTAYRGENCNLSSWDGSGLSRLGGNLDLANNPITSLTFPSTSENFTNIELQQIDIVTIDLTNFTAFTTNIFTYLNGALTGITFPAAPTVTTVVIWCYNCNLNYVDITNLTIGAACVIRFENNAMIVDDVNHMLFDLDNTVPAIGTGSINLAGTNAAPDGASGGFDGVTAKNNLIVKGYTVTTN